MKAVLGVHPGNKKKEVPITRHVIFKDKDKDKKDRTHDIMLLKLDASTEIAPIALPEEEDCRNRLNL